MAAILVKARSDISDDGTRSERKIPMHWPTPTRLEFCETGAVKLFKAHNHSATNAVMWWYNENVTFEKLHKYHRKIAMPLISLL